MKQQQGKLGIREYVSIVILMVGAKATERHTGHAVQSSTKRSMDGPNRIRSHHFYPVLSIIKNVIFV